MADNFNSQINIFVSILNPSSTQCFMLEASTCSEEMNHWSVSLFTIHGDNGSMDWDLPYPL